MAWSSHILSSGSRDRNILQRDVRAPEDYIHKLVGHRSEVYTHIHCCYDVLLDCLAVAAVRSLSIIAAPSALMHLAPMSVQGKAYECQVDQAQLAAYT